MRAVFSLLALSDTARKCGDDYFALSWLLAVMSARRLGLQVDLYCDLQSAVFLVDNLRLPFDRVFDDLDAGLGPVGNVWSIGKIAAWKRQRSKFIHLDGDFLLWQLPVVCSDFVVEDEEYPPEYLTQRVSVENAGICRPALWDWYAYQPSQRAFTTSVLVADERIADYCDIALDTFEKNRKIFSALDAFSGTWATILLEQWLLSAWCEKSSIPVSYMKNQIGSYLHLWGGKQNRAYFYWMRDIARVRFPVQFAKWQSLYS